MKLGQGRDIVPNLAARKRLILREIAKRPGWRSSGPEKLLPAAAAKLILTSIDAVARCCSVYGVQIMAQVTARNSPSMLNSWKEIASHLDRGVRTVQRWERNLQLPVHRIGKGKRSPVYALVPELKFWLITSQAESGHSGKDPHSVGREPVSALHPRNGQNGRQESPIQLSHQLIAESRELVRTIAEASVRQQHQAEILQKRVAELRLLRGIQKY
jgi:hypothetical protein